MIGDRTGAVHIGDNQTMDLKRDTIDLPFSVHVYEQGIMGLATNTTIDRVNIYLNGTLINVKNLTIDYDANLWLYR